MKRYQYISPPMHALFYDGTAASAAVIHKALPDHTRIIDKLYLCQGTLRTTLIPIDPDCWVVWNTGTFFTPFVIDKAGFDRMYQELPASPASPQGANDA